MDGLKRATLNGWGKVVNTSTSIHERNSPINLKEMDRVKAMRKREGWVVNVVNIPTNIHKRGIHP